MSETAAKAIARIERALERAGWRGGSPAGWIAWESLEAWAKAQSARSRGQRETAARKRGLTDEQLRERYLAATGTHAERSKAIQQEMEGKPGFSTPNLTKRLNALGFYGDGRKAKAPKRNCQVCSTLFQPRLNKDDRMCRKHRIRAGRG